MVNAHDTPPDASIGIPDGWIAVGDVPPVREYLVEAWRYRDFATSLALADARSHHVDTVLGNAWQLLNPTLLVGVYYLIFGIIFDVNRGVDNYLGFLVVGVFLFTFIRKSMSSGARAIINNRSITQSIRFPRVVLPVATVLAELLAFLPSIVVVIAVMLLTGQAVAWTWVLLVPLTLLLVVFNIGLALGASQLTVRFRDLDELLPFLLRLWFYLSGVLYPVSLVGDKLGGAWKTLFELNPANVYISLGREALMDGRADPARWAIGLGWAISVAFVTFLFFRRHELEYGDA